MNRKKFLDFLSDANDTQTYFVENGVVKKNAQGNPLQYSPDGWKDHQIKATRNSTYFGLFRSFSLPLKFVKQAAQIVRDRLYKYGVEDIIFYTKTRLNPLTGKHELFYKGELDLTTAKDNLDSIEAASVDGGMAKILKANESTNYEIELSGDGVNDLVLDGAELQQNAKYLIVNGSTDNRKQHLLSLELINNESRDNINAIDVDRLQFSSNSEIYSNDYWFLKASSASTFEIEWNFGVQTNRLAGTSHLPNPGQALIVRIFDESNFATAVVLQQLNGSIHFNNHNTFSGTASIPITTPIKRMYLMMAYTSSNNPALGANADEATYWVYDNATTDIINAKYTFRKPSTVIKIISPIELGNRLVKLMANDASYSLESSILSNTSIYLSSGDAIRGLTGAKIKTNLKDLFLSYNRNLCLGLSVEDKKVIIEKREYFYDKTKLIYDLGEVKNVEIKPTTDLFFNKIKIGYTNQDYDDLNGKKEFNTTYEFKSPLSKSTKEMDLTAPYRADMFGITFTQINLEGKQTTDSSSDNDVFMLDIDKTNGEVYNLSYGSFEYSGINEFLLFKKNTVGNGIDLNATNNSINFRGKNQTVNIVATIQLSAPVYYVQLMVDLVPVQTFNSASTTLNINTTLSLNTNQSFQFFITVPIAGFNLISTNIDITFTKPNLLKLFRYPSQENVVEGLLYPASAFNVRLTPKDCLLAHGAWLRGILQPLESGVITYQTSPKNTIKTTYNGVIVQGNSNEIVGNLAKNYFLPFYVSFETIVPENLFALIKLGLNGYFQFTYKSNVYKGFPMECSQKPGDDESQTFNLLFTYDNDLTKLING